MTFVLLWLSGVTSVFAYALVLRSLAVIPNRNFPFLPWDLIMTIVFAWPFPLAVLHMATMHELYCWMAYGSAPPLPYHYPQE